MTGSHRLIRSRFVYALLIVLVALPRLFSQELRGRVIQKDTKAPIGSVNIILEGTPYGTVSDSLGQFVLAHIPAGVYVLDVRHIGYKKNTYILNAERDEPITLMVELEIEPVPLEGVDVSGEAEKAKRISNIGKTIITSEQIARTGTKSLATFLRYQYPGLFPSYTRRTYERLRFVLYLNGALVQYTPELLDTMIDIEQVDYIEVYRSIGMTPTRDRGSNERVIHIHTKLPEFRR